MKFGELYEIARGLPVIDWHNHLDVKSLAADEPFGSLYSVWVAPDPYKHRAMRICGEPESLITGNAAEPEKWAAWMRTLPKLIGNPLFFWARGELALLGLASPDGPLPLDRLENVPLSDWTPSKILRSAGVEVACPCVGAKDFAGTRAFFSKLSPRIIPSLRLSLGEDVDAETLKDFHDAGCRVVDISVDDVALLAVGNGDGLASTIRIAAFAAAHGWTLLLHLGALRETSSRLRALAGPAGGYAAMRAPVDPVAVATFLNALEGADALPRTILLTLNPEAHAQLAVLSGSFTREGSPGHVQLGPAWWWCDHAEGVRDVLEKNAAYGVLSTFVGMTTDSRSLLSLARHDWFRRLFCKWLAEKVVSGDYPDDAALLRPLVEAVCYRNARAFVPR